ncbi:hypothetical protein Marme_1056 [Marinomonas mediterranea MMB-1]|jgi:hypothetical protein|uniref:Uncharacterized protein n=1 Tax=Marinomonas mediterranea (strain ATCC 700492 / JCM 21426 / NBRC 103028 / MMB-1) TaxID=717774 RepID=F2JTB3_MARM1|nr:hypothetical protein Marme_1056 [Marinomonas mediterranea MMB-1]
MNKQGLNGATSRKESVRQVVRKTFLMISENYALKAM